MRNQNQRPGPRRLAIAASIATLMGLGAAAPALRAADAGPNAATDAPLILADTNGSERRGDRQDCRDEDGVAGQDKRDCKQEGRQEDQDSGDSEDSGDDDGDDGDDGDSDNGDDTDG